MVKFSDEVHEYDGEVMWMLPMETESNLRSTSTKASCWRCPTSGCIPRGECNPDMLERFRIVSDREFASSKTAAEAGERAGRMGQAGRAQGTDGGRRDAEKGAKAAISGRRRGAGK